MQTQGACLPPFPFCIFSHPLSTAEESMQHFLGNSQFSISFLADVINRYRQRSALLLKLLESTARYKAVKSANVRDESRSTNSGIRFQAVISSLQN